VSCINLCNKTTNKHKKVTVKFVKSLEIEAILESYVHELVLGYIFVHVIVAKNRSNAKILRLDVDNWF
jgi:hypothetical protein